MHVHAGDQETQGAPITFSARFSHVFSCFLTFFITSFTHKVHRARPDVDTRILQLHGNHAAKIEWIHSAQEEKAKQKKEAKPTINKPRAMSPEMKRVQVEQIERTGGSVRSQAIKKIYDALSLF